MIMFVNRYELLGIEEIECVCDFCGKREISISYTVRDMETSNILHFGSSCIKKALRVTTKDINNELKSKISEIRAHYMPRINALDDQGNALADRWREYIGISSGFPPEGHKSHILWDAANVLRLEMKNKIKSFERP